MTQDNLSKILLRTAVTIFLIAAAIHISTYSCTSCNGDTSIEYQADTIRIRDTIRIPHPVSVTSRTIDTMTITHSSRQPRFSIGLQAGYGATISNNQLKPAPFVGIGISWNLIRF